MVSAGAASEGGAEGRAVRARLLSSSESCHQLCSTGPCISGRGGCLHLGRAGRPTQCGCTRLPGVCSPGLAFSLADCGQEGSVHGRYLTTMEALHGNLQTSEGRNGAPAGDVLFSHIQRNLGLCEWIPAGQGSGRKTSQAALSNCFKGLPSVPALQVLWV